MARDDPMTYLRLPAELKDALVKAAAENRRSLAAEVAQRLQNSFNGAPPGPEIDYLLKKLAGKEAAADIGMHTLRMRAASLAYLLEMAMELLPAGKPLPDDAFGFWKDLVEEAKKEGEKAASGIDPALHRMVEAYNSMRETAAEIDDARLALIEPNSDRIKKRRAK